MTERERLLLDAAAAVRERGEDYGKPGDHFAITIGMVNAALGHKLRVPLVTADWPIIMVCDKIAREQHKPKRDNACDMAGYAACLAEIRIDEYAGHVPKADPSEVIAWNIARIQRAASQMPSQVLFTPIRSEPGSSEEAQKEAT